MRECVLRLCTVSVLCGVITELINEKHIKKIAELLCMAALLSVVLMSFSHLDWNTYSRELAKYRDYETSLGQSTENVTNTLNRTVIEEQCRTYILDKAEELGCELGSVQFTMHWGEGVWYPVECSVRLLSGQERKPRLMDIIEADLGIKKEKQEWID